MRRINGVPRQEIWRHAGIKLFSLIHLFIGSSLRRREQSREHVPGRRVPVWTCSCLLMDHVELMGSLFT